MSCITKFLTLSAPTGTTKSWNFKVLFLPFTGTYFSESYSAYNMSTGIMAGAVPQSNTLGQFSVWKWRDDQPEPDFVLNPPTDIIEVSAPFGACKSRLCSAGFEAINTSPEIARGGMYYAWRVPPSIEPMTGPANPGSIELIRNQVIVGLPSKLNDIVNLNTTVSANAYHGAAVFSLPELETNQACYPLPTQTFIEGGTQSSQTKYVLFPTSKKTSLYNWAPCGVHVKGLVPEATFEIKARAMYEGFPQADTPDYLQSMARNPVEMSPLVMEMMSRVISELPAGFDYRENPLGEWFSKILNFLADAAPKVGAVLPLPFAAPIGSAAGALAGAVAKAVDHRLAAKAKKEAEKSAAAAATKRTNTHSTGPPRRN